MPTLSLPETILTERLLLHRLRYEDAPEIFYAYASKPAATRFMSWPTHRNIGDTLSFIGYARGGWISGKDFSYAIRIAKSNILIGGIGVIVSNNEVQFGYILSPARWGNGYATEACTAVLQELMQYPGIAKLSTFVATENDASARVLEKCGLVREALLKKFFLFPNIDSDRRDCYSYVYPLNRV